MQVVYSKKKKQNVPRSKQRNTVLIIGDSMLDEYWHGSSVRVSPEAPIPIVKFEKDEARAGGAANVAMGVSALGSNVTLMSAIGNDDAGKKLKEILKNNNINLVNIAGTSKTTKKLRVLVDGQQVSRVDFDELSSPICEFDYDLGNVSVVVLSDYNKGLLAKCENIIAKVRLLKIPIVVDPKGTNWGRYKGASYITPNDSELKSYMQSHSKLSRFFDEGQDEQLVHATKRIIRTLGLRAVVHTRGPKGMQLLTSRKDPIEFKANALRVSDVTGAGDTVVASLANALDEGLKIAVACERANVAAAIAVGKQGTSIVSRYELNLATKRRYLSEKIIFDERELQEKINEHRLMGLKIVFTNGCFDILHRGHISYLENARKLGDILVVAINDDASVKRAKGAERPINGLEARLDVLSALSSVDYVIPFSSDTPVQLIGSIKPDILAKGGDYTSVEQIVGWDLVETYGGKACLLPHIENASTSSVIDYIKSQK